MSKRRGFDYEVNAYRALKEYDISFGASPAGAASDRPDLEIKKGKKNLKTTGVELKLSPTAAGSLVLKYYGGKWSVDDHFIRTTVVANIHFIKFTLFFNTVIRELFTIY